MKVCPHCSFANEERFPTCVWCNAVLVDVRSSPAADPAHPEHLRNAQSRERRQIVRRQLGTAAVLYGVAITSLAIWPGDVLAPGALICFFLGGLAVAGCVTSDLAGQFSGAALQIVVSLACAFAFGPMQPFTFFMFAGHVVAPLVFWHWVEMIRSAQA